MRHFVRIIPETKEIGRGKNKSDAVVIAPTFNVTAKDVMKKGGNFYAVWNPETKMWSQNPDDMYKIIDNDIYKYLDEHFQKNENGEYYDDKRSLVIVKTIDDSKSRQLIEFNKWFNNLSPNFNYVPLDSDLTFLSDEVTPEMHRSKRLPYDLVSGDISAYDKIIGTLYDVQNREKIEWAIGSVLSGDSKKIEKMVVFNGPGGTGKSTILDLIQEIFKGYFSPFVAEDLASKANQFSTAAFKDNPLVAIQDDGSLAKIDSPRINEVVSHKLTVINEKNTKQYSLKPQAMLFLATNEEVDVHNTNLGITRRLLDVYPSENLLPVGEYRKLVHQMMTFEIPAIAKHCLDVYQTLGKEYYSSYVPSKMIQKTNYLQNFMFDKSDEIENHGPISRTTLFNWYKNYCEEQNFRLSQTSLKFGEQAKPYFKEYHKYKWINGKSERNVYEGFKRDMFLDEYRVTKKDKISEETETWIKLDCEESGFDTWAKDKNFKAQYTNPKTGGPKKAWDNCATTLNDIDSHKEHMVLVPESESYIRLDFDLKGDDGKKNLDKCIEAASEYPPTYAEVSRNGGLHLHYFYNGNVKDLAEHITKDIEIKKCVGKLPIRRKLTKCNDITPATLQPGSLPMKGKKNVLPQEEILNEQHLRRRIAQNLLKKNGSTIVSVTYIKKDLDKAYASNISYDVSDMESDIEQLARHSTNRKDECMDMVDEMHFKSKDIEKLHNLDDLPVNVLAEKPLTIYDIEIWPNVFIFCWKYVGEGKTVTSSINPSMQELKTFFDKTNAMGFNNRKYDNHICWYAMAGYDAPLLFKVSQDIIVHKKKEVMKPLAYGLSYTDIYDYASNPNKMSLKKWEIKLKIHHQENAYPWDQPLPEDKWDEAVSYCCNDVLATEQVFFATQGDYMARLLLARLSGFTPNDTTNKHSQQIIFGDDQHPQSQFIYVDLSKDFPGYVFDNTKKKDKSTYRGYVVGEGGFVWAKPGMYRNVITFDVASMHPSSLIAMNMFGDYYTQRFKEIVQARLAVKHEDREALTTLLGGQLLDFYDEAISGNANYTLKDLANALKTVINSVYGLTAASFDNRCRDERNIDNIVAKRGALFMVNLLEEVKSRNGNVVHIKTDSIKVVNPSEELKAFIIEYGKQWGYTFEIESEYEMFCLVNKAAYIAREKDGTWEGKGDEFINPYTFKKLFSSEEIDLDDMSETKSADKGALYLDFNEGLPEGEHKYQFVGKVSAFVPVKPGTGGGELKVYRDDKYSYVEGTTGYYWLETEYVRNSKKEYEIDMNYYDNMIEGVLEDMRQFGDPDRFIHDPDYDPEFEKLVNVPNDEDEELPFDPDYSTFMNSPVA